MVKNDKCWIIENGLEIVPAEVLSVRGNLVLIKTQYGKTLRLPKHRLFDTEEKAMEQLPKRDIKKKSKTPYDYMT